jgi:hypothetical protein
MKKEMTTMQIENLRRVPFDLAHFEEAERKEEPVILEAGCSDWPATAKWSVEYFRSQCGTLPIRYSFSSSGVHPDLLPAGSLPAAPLRATLAEFLNLIEAPIQPSSRPAFYLTGDIKTATLHDRYSQVNPKLNLISDVTPPQWITTKDLRHVGLWISPKDAATWLHYESEGLQSFYAFLKGSEVVTLYPPNALQMMYPFPLSSMKAPNFSRVNILDPDLSEFPRFVDVKPIKAVLIEGDLLYIPPFWFHSMQSLCAINWKISLSWNKCSVLASPTSVRSALLFQLMQMLKSSSSGESNQPSSEDLRMSIAALVEAIATRDHLTFH